MTDQTKDRNDGDRKDGQTDEAPPRSERTGKVGGLANGLQSGGVKPGGGPGATVVSIGTGGGSNVDQPTGDSARNNIDEDVG